MNVISNFAAANTTIAAAIAKLMAVTHVSPKNFRLSVITPDDVVEAKDGQYQIEAPVLIALLDTAYAEVVSLLNRTTRKEQTIALHDRHRYASGWDDTYDGNETAEETEESIECQLGDALDRAAVILRYMKHVASIKAGGAEWLAGFDVDKWVPVVGLTDDPKGTFTVEDVAHACTTETNLWVHIQMGRVQKIHSVVDNRCLHLKPWLRAQLARKNQDDAWRNKLAYALVCDVEVEDIPVNTAVEYIGDIVSRSAFNRHTTRLEDAMRRVANSAYFRLGYAINAELIALKPTPRNVEKALKKAYSYLPYSEALQADIKITRASPEWEDYQLDMDVRTAENEALRDERQALREMAMFNIEKRAIAIAETRSKADSIRALIATQRAELLAPKVPQPSEEELAARAAKKEAAKAKAAATRAATRAAKEAAKQTKGIVGTSKMPRLNTKGLRSVA